jgi:hypothetical protein
MPALAPPGAAGLHWVMPPRPVFYNQDTSNVFYTTPHPITPADVDHMVDEVADGGATVMLVNANAQRAAFRSRVLTPLWEGYTPGDRAWFGGVDDASVPNREHFIAQTQRLDAQGCNYLARALARCHARGIGAGVSIRLNDMHDALVPDSHLHNTFYLAHPELRLDEPGRGWGGHGLDFAHAAVRDFTLAYVEEIVSGFQLQWLELDFLRFAQYLRRGDGEPDPAPLTDLVRRARALLRRHRPEARLVARVAATPGACRGLGTDAGAWAREGLINDLVIGNFLHTGWRFPVAAFRTWTGGRVPIHVSNDFIAADLFRPEARRLSTDTRLVHGFAAAAHAAGADGVYAFNFFCAREAKPPQEPVFAALRACGDPAALASAPLTYLQDTAGCSPETDLPATLPVPCGPEGSRSFTWSVLPRPGACWRCRARVDPAPAPDAKPWLLWVEGRPQGEGAFQTDGWIEWTLRGDGPAAPTAETVLTNPGPAATLTALELLVDSPWKGSMSP